jgi:hypothetical protein
LNRKERRRAKATPLARPGVPIHSGIAESCSIPGWCSIGLPAKTPNETIEEIVARKGLHGPFDTQAEADADAIVGEDCEVKKSGMWDPVWSKPQ